MLFGTLASTVMLYGFSLIFGFAGTTNIYQISELFALARFLFYLHSVSLPSCWLDLASKLPVVPFHFWAPDVYEGSPTPVAGFLSTASKAAGFAVIVRFFFVAFPDYASSWTVILAALSAITMTVGNLLAISQTNVKRLLAYSSIAHAGYALIGVVAFSQLGAASVVFYLAAYIVTNLLAFGVVMAFSRVTGLDDIKDYAGMSRRNPWLALMMLRAFLSLAGMPPFGGFVGKVFVFAAGVQADYTWLVDRRYSQLHHWCVLLPQCDEVCLSLSHAE